MSWEERNVSDQQTICPQQRGNVGRRLRLPWHQPFLWAIVVLVVGGVLAIGVAGSNGNSAAYGSAFAQSSMPNAGTLAIVGANGANLYAAPGGESLQSLSPGTVLTAVGRSADNLWVVVHSDNDLAGWVEVSEVVLFGIEQLPVMMEGTVPVAAPTTEAQPGASPNAPVLMPTPTATLLPSPTPTATPIPTDTPTPLPTATPTATPIPTLPPTNTGASSATTSGESSLVAVVRGGGAALYDKPGGTETEQLPAGTALTAWGRSEDEQWLVVIASSGAAGWVQTADVVIFNIEALPVLDSATGLPTAPDAQAAPTTSAAEPPSPALPSATANAPEEAESGEQNPAPEATTPPDPADPNAITASVTVTDSRLNIRSGPGTGFAIVDKADPGDVFEVSGRNVEANWIELVMPELEDGYGWVAADYVTLSRPILSVPVSERASEAAPATDAPASAPPAVAKTYAADPVAMNEVSGAPTDMSGRLVFQSSNGGMIYVYDLASGAVAELTGGFDPAISPDGSTVAFTRIGGDHGLFLIDIDGQNERRIWNGSEGLRGPTWSPDGKWIAFVRMSGAFKCRDVGFGICLPDNEFLTDFPLTNIPEFNLSRVDTDGQNFRDLDALNTAQAPSWQPDGIVYQASTGLEITQDLPVVETKALVQAPYYQDPTWQPNGNRVLFQAREGSHWEIFTINTDGSGLSALTKPTTALVENLPSNVAPAWSPDGQWIVFLSNRDEENDAGAWRLWVMNADGSNQHPLPLDVPLEYSFTNEQAVSWGVAG